MTKPETRGQRRGGRNRQFFECLIGLATALDRAIDQNKPQSEHDPAEAQRLKASKLGAAQAKRERRAQRNINLNQGKDQ